MFELHRINNVRALAPTIKQIPADNATTYAVGDALVITSGKAAKATGATAPTYICAEKATGKTEISAYPVDKNTEYKTTAAGAVVVGTKYTIGSDAASITTTSASGVAEVVSVAGSEVVVKF